MVNALAAKCQPSRSRQPLLFLSAFALVAYASAFSAGDGQLKRNFITQSKTDSNEERGITTSKFPSRTVEDLTRDYGYALRPLNIDAAMMPNPVPVLPIEIVGTMDAYILAFLERYGSQSNWPAEFELHLGHLIEMLRSDHHEGITETVVIKTLVQLIDYYVSVPLTSIRARNTPGHQGAINHFLMENALVKLDVCIVNFWRRENYDIPSVFNFLDLPYPQEFFSVDFKTALVLDFVARSALNSPVTFDRFLNRLAGAIDFEVIVVKVTAGLSNSFDGTSYRYLFEAILRSRHSVEAAIRMLYDMGPSLVIKELVNSPLELWLEYFNTYFTNKERLYLKVLKVLLDPNREAPRFIDQAPRARGKMLRQLNRDKGRINIPPNEPTELALVETIAKEWAQNFQGDPGSTHIVYAPPQSTSPFVNPLFEALCAHWKTHGVKSELLQTFLHNVQDLAPGWQQRVVLMFRIITAKPRRVPTMLWTPSEETEAQLVACLLDWGGKLHHKVSDPLFNRWRSQEKSKRDVFSLLDLQSPDNSDLFKNHLLPVWYRYEPNNNTPIERVRDALDIIMSMNDYEDPLQILGEAVKTSNFPQSELSRVLYDLYAVWWIEREQGQTIIQPHVDDAGLRSRYNYLLVESLSQGTS